MVRKVQNFLVVMPDEASIEICREELAKVKPEFQVGFVAVNFPEKLTVHGKVIHLADILSRQTVRNGGYSKIITFLPELAGEAVALADYLRVPVLPLALGSTLDDWQQPGVMPRPKRQKTVGILGGMGPLATADFFTKLIQATPAATDQEHLRIVVENTPDMPDRVDSLMGRGPSPVLALRQCGLRLQEAEADMIVIPCNTAHAFLPELQPYWSIPVISIIDAAVSYVHREFPNVKKVGLLATSGTIVYRVYTENLEKIGLQTILPSSSSQVNLVTRSIYPPDGVKAGKLKMPHQWLSQAAMELIEQGAELIILGCTEIPLVLQNGDLPVPVIDPTSILAETTVKMAGFPS